MICFGYGLGKEYIKVHVHLNPIRISEDRYLFGHGHGPYWPKDGLWKMADPDYPERHRAQIRDDILPELKKIRTYEQFRQAYRKYYCHGTSPFAVDSSVMALTFGEFDEAAEILKDYWDHNVIDAVNQYQAGLGDRLIDYGNDLPRADKRALLAYLHERQAADIKTMKLEKHWQPTPFPAEEKGLV